MKAPPLSFQRRCRLTNQQVTLAVREQKRLFVITEVLAGRWTALQAAAKLELSLRQMRRLIPKGHQDGVAAYRRVGPARLVHGNR